MHLGFPPARSIGERDRTDTAKTAIVLAAVLVLYGNLLSLGTLDVRRQADWAYILSNLAFLGLLLLWAVMVHGLSLREIGITRDRAARSALFGIGLAVLVSLPVILYFAFPIVVDEPIKYEQLDDWSLDSFVLYTLVKQPIGTALFEETAFRGILQAKMISAFSLRAGIAGSALTFALWHLVINYRTVQETNVSDSVSLVVLSQVGSLVGLFVGGLFMSLLRHFTGNLAGPIAFHWLVVILMTGALILLNR